MSHPDASAGAVGPVCARCPRALGRSCCEVGPGEALATLTRADVARIAAHTGLSARRFVEEEGLDEEAAAAYEASRPLFRGYFLSFSGPAGDGPLESDL